MKRTRLTAFIAVVFLTAWSIVFFVAHPASAAEPNVVPGEIIVQYKDGQTPPEIQSAVSKRAEKAKSFFGAIQNTAENLQTQARGGKTPEQKLDALAAANKKLRVKNSRQLYGKTNTKLSSVTNTYVVSIDPSITTPQAVQTLAALPEVIAVQPNYRVHTFVTPNDPFYSQMWNLTKIQAPQAWDITQGSDSVTVAVIDTGIDYTNPDLSTQVVKGPDFVNNDNDPMDDNFHGTHVAGTIGATTNNAIGVSGINWHVKLLAIKVMDNLGKGAMDNVLAGITYASDHGARVASLSLGGAGACDTLTQNIVNDARTKGLTIVIAAGNDNADASSTLPGNCQGIITVGATDSLDHRASFSNFGSIVDIAAPGVGIISTAPTFKFANGVAQASGTSMATPHVAGVAALMLSVNPNLTPDQIESMLKSSGDPITTDQPIGGKRLNAYQAVIAAGGAQTSPTVIPSATSIPSATPASTTPVPADINHDGRVDLLDYAIWRCEFLGGGTCSNPFSNKSADINRDGQVLLRDFNIWRNAL